MDFSVLFVVLVIELRALPLLEGELVLDLLQVEAMLGVLFVALLDLSLQLTDPELEFDQVSFVLDVPLLLQLELLLELLL